MMSGPLLRGVFRWFALVGVAVLVVMVAFTGSADNTVRLVKMEPGGEVPTKTNFIFYFSADVVPADQVGRLATTEKVKFKPAVPGRIRWETARRMRYYPETTLLPSTAYTVEFAADLPAGVKKTLTGKRVLKFSTERFQVVEAAVSFSYLPENKEGLMLQARLKFNYPVAADSLQRNLSLAFADRRQPIRYTIRMADDDREAVITSEMLQRGTSARRIELSLPKGFQCTGGGLGLAERYVRTIDFHERRPLAVNEVTAAIDGGRSVITIRCSEPVNADVIEDFIRIEPAVEIAIQVVGEAITITGADLKAGSSYRIKVIKGLPALNGRPLRRDYQKQVTFPDLEPSVGFNSPGRYLSSRGMLNLGLETVNLNQVELEFAKIYANNLVPYLNRFRTGRCYSSDLERLGRIMERRTIAVKSQENTFVTTPVNLAEFMTDAQRGIFQVVACDPERRWRSAAKVVIVTDLGILAKFGPDELVVWVNSLDTLAAKPGVRVSLVSYNNQEIAAGETDGSGLVRFTGLRRQLQDYRSYIILAQSGADFSFVCLDDGLIDTTDFNVAGRPDLAHGYEAFLYTDRGVFRPGDRANVVAVLRGPQAGVPEEFPLRLEVVGPDGMVFREFTGSTKTAGICEFQVELPDYVRTGKYTAILYAAEEAVGGASFNVEEFMPDRIKVELAAGETSYYRGDTATLSVTGTNLFGPPAAGRRVDMAVRLESHPFSPAAYRSYTFGDPYRDFQAVEEASNRGELDENGKAEFSYKFPENLNPPGMLRAVFQATVTEEGGRSVSGYTVVDYHPYQAYIGLRRGDYYAKVGEDYPIQLVALDPEGKPIAGTTLTAEVFSITWNSIYRRDRNGNYTYQSEREERRISRDSVKLGNGSGTFAYRATDWGCYKIVFTDQRTGARSACEFYATGWGYAPWAMDHPDRIELDLDKQSYRAGEKATVQIRAPFAGRALVTVERERVYDMFVVELDANTGVISIPIKKEYRPNVYISVHLIRAVKALDKRAPTRAYGTVSLGVDCGEQRLGVDISAADEIRPNREIEIQVAVAGGSAETYLTLAAVDEGICQLTEFTTPDPWAFFYGKRGLGITSYDLYGMLLPEVAGADSSGAPSGDEDTEGLRRRNLNPIALRRVEPVSLWSGLVRLDGSGRARIKLNIPQFNGTLRLMAVAVSGAKFGAGTKKMLVREPIVMTATFPRFMAPEDRAVIPVAVFNGTGRDGTFQIKLDAAGPVSIDGYDHKDLTLEAGQEKTVRFAVVAGKSAGQCHFDLTAAGNNVRAAETTELAIRPPYPLTNLAEAGACNAKKPAGVTLGGSWLPGTEEYALCLASLPTLKFTGGLRYLLAYPYGCIEQTTSRLFPLLYFEDLARVARPDLFADDRADRYLRDGIEKIEAMQLRDGGFSYWPGCDWSSDWNSVYTANFLVEARRAGRTVSDRVYQKMLAYLQRLAKKQVEGAWSLQLRVYALYVLSLAGKPQLSSMAYVKGQRLNDLYLDTRAQLAAAYYYAGDKKTARDLLPNTFAAATGGRERGGNLNSVSRADAIILGVLADLDPDHPAVPKLAERLAAGAKAWRWGTTQENAFAFMALGKLYQRQGAASYTGEVLVDGRRIATFDSKTPVRLTDPRLGRGRVTIRITGTGDCYYYAESSGVPLKPPAASDRGMTVRRELYDRAGQKVDPAHIRQGDLIVVKIIVETRQGDVDNVAIVDLLPTGLEIENPRLASSAGLGWVSGKAFTPAYMDIRDDRLLLFADFEKAGTYHFYYAARAVTCGTFILPPIKAECMYEPEVMSLSPGGQISIEG